jgi:hypothetical protein
MAIHPWAARKQQLRHGVNPHLAYEGNGTTQGGLLWPFIKNKDVYWCPTDLATNAGLHGSREQDVHVYHEWSGLQFYCGVCR